MIRLNERLQGLSITRKLTLLIASVATAVALLTAAAHAISQIYTSRIDLVETQTMLTHLIADELVGPLAFENRAGAHEVLDALFAIPGVVGAVVQWPDGREFVRRGEVPESSDGPDIEQPGYRFELKSFRAFDDILLDGRLLGRLQVVTSLDKLGSRLAGIGILTLITIVASVGFALGLANRLQRIVSKPVLNLVDIAERHSGENLVQASASGRSNDEIARLTDAFNAMFERIAERDRALRQHRDHLEELVRERTRELEQAVEDSQAARKKAEAANLAKSQFLANMSHEIRTPMNGVLGISELLRDTPLNDRQKQLVRHLLESSQMLLVVINDILDLSKIEAGKLDLSLSDFNPWRLFEETVGLIRNQAESKDLSLDLDLAADLPQWVRGDPIRLRQILLNLLTNAVKFTERGGIRVRAWSGQADADRPRIVVEVEDSGIGISADKQKFVFDNFVQADESATRRYGGTGLGLAIVRRLLAMMKGDISVESEPGRGSVFRFDLELEPARSRPETTAEQARDHGRSNDRSAARGQTKSGGLPTRNGRSLRILLAEDNPVNQEVAVGMLGSLGCDVTVAENGAAALDAITANPGRFDIVLMDCQMPVMDGMEATRRIRALATDDRRIPILAVTANAFDGSKSICLAAGMDDMLSKPFRRHELLSLLHDWCGGRDQTEPEERREAAIEPDAPTLERRPLDALRALDGDGSNRILRRAIVKFSDYGDKLIDQMVESVANDDAPELSRLAHSLKSSSANLGAAGLASLCQDIERLADAPTLPADIDRRICELKQTYQSARRELMSLVEEPPTDRCSKTA